MAVNTNGFWGNTIENAIEKVKILKNIGLHLLTVSTDDFHEDYIRRKCVLNVVNACKIVHLEVRLQFVATKKSTRLADFLKEHGDVLLNVECREIPCHPVGRAQLTVTEEDLFLQTGTPSGLCPSAILSISAYGKVIPCCNTAGHLPALQVGTIDESLPHLHEKFVDDPVLFVLRSRGPQVLMDAAVAAGYIPRHGYVDRCHLCYELFKDNQIAKSLRETATNMREEALYEVFVDRYEQQVTQQP